MGIELIHLPSYSFDWDFFTLRNTIKTKEIYLMIGVTKAKMIHTYIFIDKPNV